MDRWRTIELKTTDEMKCGPRSVAERIPVTGQVVVGRVDPTNAARRGGRRPAGEKVVQEKHRIRDVDRTVVIRITGLHF